MVFLQRDAAAMQRGDGPGERQAEPVARALARGVEPDKTLEDPRAVLGRNAGAVIGDFETDRPAPSALRGWW